MLIIAGALLAGLIISGKIKSMDANDWLALGILLIGINFMRGGNIFMGGALAGVAAVWRLPKWGGFKWRGLGKNGPEQIHKPRDFELDRARSLLGVHWDADPSAINTAWRARLAEHHPDRGGDEQLARQINRARDILLEDLERSKAP